MLTDIFARWSHAIVMLIKWRWANRATAIYINAYEVCRGAKPKHRPEAILTECIDEYQRAEIVPTFLCRDNRLVISCCLTADLDDKTKRLCMAMVKMKWRRTSHFIIQSPECIDWVTIKQVPPALYTALWLSKITLIHTVKELYRTRQLDNGLWDFRCNFSRISVVPHASGDSI
jgi:hypothetical protein